MNFMFEWPEQLNIKRVSVAPVQTESGLHACSSQ